MESTLVLHKRHTTDENAREFAANRGKVRGRQLAAPYQGPIAQLSKKTLLRSTT